MQPLRPAQAAAVLELCEAAFEIFKQSVVDRGAEFRDPASAALPLGGPQHEGRVVLGNRKNANLSIIPRHVLFRDRFRPVVNAVPHHTFRIIQTVQGFVKRVV